MRTRELKSKNPDEVRIVNLSDAHMSPFNPRSWKANYWEHTKDSIGQVLKFAKANDVDVLTFSGDQFHLKAPARNPLYFVAEAIELLTSAGILCVGIAGNHDLKMGSLVGLKGQPLEVLIKAGTFVLLDEEEIVVSSSNTSVRIAGESYNHGRAEGSVEKKKDGADYLVNLAHFWFGQATGEFYGEPMYGPDRLGKGESDIYLIGHHHMDQGIVRSEGKSYVVVGSISRTGSHSTDTDRKPAASYMKFKGPTQDITVIRPKILPIEEALDLEVRQAAQKEEKMMKAFIEELKSTKLGAADPKQALADLDLPDEVMKRALKYLDEASQ